MSCDEPNSDRPKLLMSALMQVAERLELSQFELYEIVGIQPRDLTGCGDKPETLRKGTTSWEQARLLVSMYSALVALVGDDGLARAWLHGAVDGLGRKRPRDILFEPNGLAQLCAYLEAHRTHG